MVVFGQLEAHVRTLYEAESSVRWSSDRFLSSANDALDELSEGTGFYERFTPVPLKAGQTYYDMRGFVPDDAFSINSVYNVDAGRWLDPIGIRDLNTQRWETTVGDPHKYLIRGLFWLGVYPRPNTDVGTIRVFYSGLAPHFKDSDSALSDLPDDFVPALEDYMLYDLNAKDRDADKAMLHWNSYLAREKSLRAFVKSRVVTSRSGRLGRG